MSEVNDVREMFENDGKSMEVVKLVHPDKILVWDKSGKATSDSWTGMSGGTEELLRLIKLEDIDLELLKKLKVWNVVAPEVQSAVSNHVRVIVENAHDVMAKARAGRKVKFANIPREMICVKCAEPIKVVPSTVAAKVEKLGILLVDYIKDFHCQHCRGPVTRGKKPNPAFAHLPKVMKCKCGKEVVINVYQLKNKAEKMNTTIEELIKNFECQGCNRTIGRKKIIK